jgi:hypothetical protein
MLLPQLSQISHCVLFWHHVAAVTKVSCRCVYGIVLFCVILQLSLAAVTVLTEMWTPPPRTVSAHFLSLLFPVVSILILFLNLCSVFGTGSSWVMSFLFLFPSFAKEVKKLIIRKKKEMKKKKRACLPWKRSWIRYQPDTLGVLCHFSFYLASEKFKICWYVKCETHFHSNPTSHCRCCMPTAIFPTIRNTLCSKQ